MWDHEGSLQIAMSSPNNIDTYRSTLFLNSFNFQSFTFGRLAPASITWTSRRAISIRFCEVSGYLSLFKMVSLCRFSQTNLSAVILAHEAER